MEKFLNILESPQPQQQQQDNFDEEKVRYISSKISIWNFFEIPEATTRNFSVPEKSKMFREYYARLCDKYYGSTGKKIIFFLVWPGCFYVCFFWCVFGLGLIFIFFFAFFLAFLFSATSSIYWNWQRYFSGRKRFQQNINVKKCFSW